ncbi:MAG: alanine/glycine:cation symporter family protein [Chlamydiota bacterium]
MTYSNIIYTIHDFIWGTPLLIFLVGGGLFLTIMLRGIQLRYLGYALKLTFCGHEKLAESSGDISHFQSLTTALAAIIGVGNIAGVSTAVATGGMGALFWMWVIALLGMAISYSESLMAIKYRTTDKRGEMSGGPMYYMERALGLKWLGILFAIGGCVAALTMGNLTQANSMSDAIISIVNVNPWWIGITLAFLIGLMIFGGIKSIGRITSILVPVMALFYIIGGSIVIIVKYQAIPEAFGVIFTSAFKGQAAMGGFVGSTMIMAVRMGVARGIFSSESGLGTTAIASSAAKTDTPGRQSVIAMTGGFLSTIIICTITGLVIGTTGVLGEVDTSGKIINGIPMASAAFNTVIPVGGPLVNIGAILFGLSTILSWAYYGEKCIEYLVGEKAIIIFRLIFIVAIALGCVMEIDIVWSLADIANVMMTAPNMLALLLLSPAILKETRHFKEILRQEKQEL